MPDDETVFRQSQSCVVRYDDVLPAEELRGEHLQFSSCATCTANVCKRALQAEMGGEFVAFHNTIVQRMNHLADVYGKERCNAVDILVMAECRSNLGVLRRHFILMARAWFKPKFQLYCCCEGPDDVELVLPFYVEITSEHSRLCPGKVIAKIRTTDEIALCIRHDSVGGSWEFFELEYTLPEDDLHLRRMEVHGVSAIQVSGVVPSFPPFP